MRLPRSILAVGLLLGAGFILGCGGDQPGKPMKDAKPGTDTKVEHDTPLKGGGKKPHPPEENYPDAPKPGGGK
jgi:hypothetical protein